MVEVKNLKTEKEGMMIDLKKIIYGFFLCGFFISVIFSSNVNAWPAKIHKEVARDAWYYMEHSPYATQRQRSAIQWFFNKFNRVSNPWNKIAEGTTYPDEVEYVCFVGASHKRSFQGHSFSSWFHFFDMYSAHLDYEHSRHSNCRNFSSPNYKGEHNCWDGYNYRRHEELLGGYGSWYEFPSDVDGWAAYWIDDDNLCLQHGMKSVLEWWENFQGGKGENGYLIGPNYHGCYTKWNDDNPNSDFWNMIFAPIDNLGRACYQLAVGFRNYSIGEGTYIYRYEGVPLQGNEDLYQEQALYYLGASMHVADASVFHHIFNSSGWGHSEFENWANHWYSDQQWFQNKHQKIKWYIESYYTKDGIDPIDRPFRWLVHQLALVVFNNESIDAVWDRYVDEDDSDTKYWNYCLKAYPATVALMVILLEKFYKGKEEAFQQQGYDHPLSENVISVTPTTPSVKVKVVKYTLVDETNPESCWPFGCSDEIYGKFTVEDGISAENHRVPSSGYYSMDEGNTQSINKVIFETPHVGQFLKIKAKIMEVDDVSSDDVVGENTLQLTQSQNWGKGLTHIIKCKYPDSDGHVDVYVKIE